MAMNQVFDNGDSLSLPVPAGTVAGDPVKVGALVGFARNDRGTGGNPATHATVDLVGCYEVDVDGALTVGQAVYITADRDLTATATDNTLFGHSVTAKGAGTGPATVRPARV